ncbi:MAG: hypothetical protein V4489_10020 [Chlamydiota bacterium]
MLIKNCIIISVCVFSSLCGDWNTSFDESTARLLSQLVDVDTEEYEKQYEIFMQIRDAYVRDSDLRKRIEAMTSLDKEIILTPKKNGTLIKKRRNNHIYESFAWEIATLLSSSSCVVPSFPMDIGGKQVIIQKKESFSLPSKESTSTRKTIIKGVSLDAYWKAHFQAYLLGMGDLVGRNIGVSEEGKIRFFDIESSFKYQNEPKRWDQSFYTGFIAESLVWSQFRKSLDLKTVISLKQFIASWDHLEENMAIYLACRPFPLDIEGFLYRLNKIKSFPLEEGKTFEDFYRFVFPKVGLGLDELSSILTRILQKKMNHGEALVFSCRKLKKMELSSKEKKAVQKWLTTYID